MGNRLQTNQYNLSVEGETEQWYFEWLEEQINKCPKRKYNVSLRAKKCPSPRKYYKSINNLTKPFVYHICDVESKDPVHVDKFSQILLEMKEAKQQKKVSYELGYSNFAFELWIVLHKIDFNGCQTHRSHYLTPINKIFGEKFLNLDQYKNEANFKRCINKLSLDDVINAIKRAEKIQSDNIAFGNKKICLHGYEYYEDNPALSINDVIKKILTECGIIKK